VGGGNSRVLMCADETKTTCLPTSSWEDMAPSGFHYLAEAEMQHSQWTLPEHYVHDPTQGFALDAHAYWDGSVQHPGGMNSMCSYECGAAWQRSADCYGQVFWSNPVSGERFFESPPWDALMQHVPHEPAALPYVQDFSFIDTVSDCRAAASSLMKEVEIGVDLEGVDVGRCGKISLVQVSTHAGCVFLFDITSIGSAAFEAGGLQELFQSAEVRKVIFDGRADNDALYHLFGTMMERAYDVQILHALKYSSSDDRFVKGFQKCLHASGILNPAEIRRAKALKEQGKKLYAPEMGGSYYVWEQRPLPQILIDYAVADVQHLLRMKRQWATPRYDTTVETLTSERIRKIVLAPKAPRGAHMSQRDFPLTGGENAGESSGTSGAQEQVLAHVDEARRSGSDDPIGSDSVGETLTKSTP